MTRMLIITADLRDVQNVAEAIRDDNLLNGLLNRTHTDVWTVTEEDLENNERAANLYEDLNDLRGNLMDELGGYDVSFTTAVY